MVMKVKGLIISLIIMGCCGLFCGNAFAQETPPDGKTPVNGFAGNQNQNRPNMLAMLNLTPEQVQKVRRLNAERRPLIEAAQLRLRNATKDLDVAIYADESDDTLVETRTKELQAAQSEIARIRAANEYAIRKILTPEQLVRFRDIRTRFEEIRRDGVGRKGQTDGQKPATEQPLRKIIRQQLNQRRPI